jgi:hypothetical protein
MSLTSHIANPGPVLDFMNAALPELAARGNALRVEFRQTLPDGDAIISLPPDYMRQSSVAGGAIERRLSWALGAAPDDQPEKHGVEVVGQYQRMLQKWGRAPKKQMDAAELLMRSIGNGIITGAGQLVEQHGIADRQRAFVRDDAVEQRLARAAVGMTRLDAAYHSGGHSLVETTFFGKPLQKRLLNAKQSTALGVKHALDETLAPVLDDIVALTHLAAESPFAALREATVPGEARSSVIFTGSAALGGAEADIIVKGFLLDVKGTHRVRTLLTRDLRQLAGYLLLDLENNHDIQQIGMYRARNGHLFSMAAEDFIKKAGSRVRLQDLREQFDEQVITPMEEERRVFMEQMAAARAASPKRGR